MSNSTPETPSKFIAPAILFQGSLLVLNSSYHDNNDSSAPLIQRLQKEITCVTYNKPEITICSTLPLKYYEYTYLEPQARKRKTHYFTPGRGPGWDKHTWTILDTGFSM